MPKKKIAYEIQTYCKTCSFTLTPSKHEKFKLLRQRNKNIRELNRRAGKQLNKIKIQLKICKTKCSNLDESTILQNLTSNNIPKNYQLVIKETVNIL